MRNYDSDGKALRLQIKELVLDFMKNNEDCLPNAEGMPQADIFRACGLDWGDQSNSTSSQQHFWVVALLRVLENEGKVSRVLKQKGRGYNWRLK